MYQYNLKQMRGLFEPHVERKLGGITLIKETQQDVEEEAGASHVYSYL